MGDTILDGLAYRLLKVLSHHKNLRADEQISKIAEKTASDTCKASLFLGYLGKYLDLDFKNRKIIDIGCGNGDLTITIAKSGARKVVGVDVDQERIATARRNAIVEKVDNLVTFECADFVNTFHSDDIFDIAFSQDALEHIASPLSCLYKIRDCLTPGGVLATIFGPLWCSPYGAHMWGFTPIPWVHFIFPEKAVLRVRTECFRPGDHVERYEDIRGHLNRMTVKKFKRYVIQAGFVIQTMRLNPRQDKGKYKLANYIVNETPLLQELGSHRLLAVLRKPE